MHRIIDEGIEYYTIDGLKDVQKQMLCILKRIDEICKENNINYFLDGGTAIGALRHGKMIPWDDDLDISLLKHEYLKLIKILTKEDHSKYFLFDYNLNLHACSFFGERTSLFTSKNYCKRNIYPIKIDIRPINCIKNSEISIHENRIFRELANYVIFHRCNLIYKNEVIKTLKYKFENSYRTFLEYYNWEYGLEKDFENALFVHPYMEYTTDRLYTYDELFPLRRIWFSGINTNITATDVMLAEYYGDYFKLPEINERKPVARKVFIANENEELYAYLIDKKKKKLIDRVGFALKATRYCQ